MVISEKLYNKFAPYYRWYSKRQSAYINSVDNLILKNLPEKVDKVLDVGCGDGIRGARLFEIIGGKRMLMIDNSDEMIKLAKKLVDQRIKVKKLNISLQKPKLEGQYNMILCLWNVLGHISSIRQRLIALKNMKRALEENGKIYIDISNRYNFRYYGFKKVFYNVIKDIFKPNPKNGDFNYKIQISKSKMLNSTCHFFNPFEFRFLIKKAGLTVEKIYSVDYKTGQLRTTFFEGHLLYILVKSV